MTASLAVSKQILHSKLELSGASSSPPSAPPDALLLLSLRLLLLLGPAVAMLWTFLATHLGSLDCFSHQKPEREIETFHSHKFHHLNFCSTFQVTFSFTHSSFYATHRFFFLLSMISLWCISNQVSIYLSGMLQCWYKFLRCYKGFFHVQYDTLDCLTK